MRSNARENRGPAGQNRGLRDDGHLGPRSVRARRARRPRGRSRGETTFSTPSPGRGDAASGPTRGRRGVDAATPRPVRAPTRRRLGTDAGADAATPRPVRGADASVRTRRGADAAAPTARPGAERTQSSPRRRARHEASGEERAVKVFERSVLRKNKTMLRKNGRVVVTSALDKLSRAGAVVTSSRAARRDGSRGAAAAATTRRVRGDESRRGRGSWI